MAEATIVGIRGMYRSAVIPIRVGETLVFGQDAAVAHVIISQDANLVSRKHCGICYVGGQTGFVVIDYSTKGTFVNGDRISKGLNVTTKPGSVVSLGGSNNSFILSGPLDAQTAMTLLGDSL